MTNSNHGTRLLFSRGPILTFEALNLYKGKCIFELKPTCAQKNRLALTRNWTPLEAFKYKPSDPHLDIIIKHILLLSLHWIGSYRSEVWFAKFGSHMSEIAEFEARSCD